MHLFHHSQRLLQHFNAYASRWGQCNALWLHLESAAIKMLFYHPSFNGRQCLGLQRTLSLGVFLRDLSRTFTVSDSIWWWGSCNWCLQILISMQRMQGSFLLREILYEYACHNKRRDPLIESAVKLSMHWSPSKTRRSHQDVWMHGVPYKLNMMKAGFKLGVV